MKYVFQNVSSNELIPVQSAFMMLAIYKIPMITGCRYSGFGIHNEVDCEHVAFHRDMIERHDAKIRLSPLIYCQGDEGYAPLG
jgi:hypothetical protein